MGLTDTLIIGHYSTAALAGVGLGSSIYELPANALFGALMAFKILQPRFAAAEDTSRSRSGLKLILRGIAPWATMAFAGLVAASVAMMWIGGKSTESSTFQAGAYLLGRSPSVLVEAVTSAFAVTLVSWGQVRVPIIVFLVSSGANLLLDFPLVYGLGPLPAFGAFGDGLASSIGVTLLIPWLIPRIRTLSRPSKLPEGETLERFTGWRRLTLPAVGSAALDYAGNIAFTALIALGGTAGLAGARIATATHLLAFVLVASLSSAALYILGQGHDRDPAYAIRNRRAIRVRFVGLSGGLGIVIGALAWPIAFISSPDGDVRTVATALILLVAAVCPMIGWTYANVSILRAIERTKSDFLSNVIAVWAAQVPLALIGLLALGAPGAFGGLIAYWICRGAITQLQVSRAAQTAAVTRTN